MSREAVYDEKIAPLMAQIIALCQEHDIPILASFELDDGRDADEREHRGCTTRILPANASPGLIRAGQIIHPD